MRRRAGHEIDRAVQEIFLIQPQGLSPLTSIATSVTTAGTCWYGPDTVTNPGLMVRNVWMGRPNPPVWLAWFGSLYRPLVESFVPGDLAEVRDAALLVRRSEMPETKAPAKAARTRWPFLRRELKEQPQLNLPAKLVLKATGTPPGAWQRDRLIPSPKASRGRESGTTRQTAAIT